jgi:hypothetical protein
MSPRVLSVLSWIFLILYVVLTCYSFQDTPRGSLFWYVEGFNTLFLMGHFLCSAYSSDRGWPQSPGWRKALVILTSFVLVTTLLAMTIRVVDERQRYAKQIAVEQLEQDREKLKLEIKQFDYRKPALSDIQRLEAQLKDIELRSKELKK